MKNILFLASLMVIALSFGATQAEVLVAAHRGDSAQSPENTIASIQSAIGSADLTEMDIRTTADGRLVLMHDGNVARTTDGRGPVKRLTMEELQALDACWQA